MKREIYIFIFSKYIGNSAVALNISKIMITCGLVPAELNPKQIHFCSCFFFVFFWLLIPAYFNLWKQGNLF